VDGRFHAMSLTDNPGGGHAIMPDELAKEVQQTGIDCLVHFTCKDLTRNGAISRAYALERMGFAISWPSPATTQRRAIGVGPSPPSTWMPSPSSACSRT